MKAPPSCRSWSSAACSRRARALPRSAAEPERERSGKGSGAGKGDFRRRSLDGEVAFDSLEAVAGQGQVGLLPLQDQVQEQALLVAGVPEQPDQVVLLAEGDQDVLDGVV